MALFSSLVKEREVYLLDRIADELTSTLLVSNSLYSLRSLY